MVDALDFSGLLDEYRDEAGEQLAVLDAALLGLERGEGLSEERRRSLLRALHTLKGNSGMLGFAPVRDLVHEAENIFKRPPEQWDQALLDCLFRAAAELRRAVDQAGRPGQEEAFARLARVSLEPRPGGAEAARAEAAPAGGGPAAATSHGVATPRAAARGATAAPDTEASAGVAQPRQGFPPPGAELSGGAELRGEGEAGTEDLAAEGEDVLRVPFSRLDTLLNQVGELVGADAALGELVRQNRDVLRAAGLRRQFEDLANRLARLSDAIGRTASDLRLVPVGRVLARFPTLARDLARAQGKQVHVVVNGEDTSLDKSTVDSLAAPLLHLVRNAVDHGIEPPAEREAQGKPPVGTLRLTAEQVGDEVRITVEDDGRGLDRERVLRRAREAGLVGPGEEPPLERLREFIFAAGFSTRSETDTVSGQGIGLDVVQKSVTAMRGRLEVIEPEHGGMAFVLRLPLTVAVIPALFFEIAGERLAFPTAEVEETLLRPPSEWVGRTEVVRHRGQLLPVARPERLFGWRGGADVADDEGRGAPEKSRGKGFLVVVRSGPRAAAVAVDRLYEQQEVVVKKFPARTVQPRGVSGVTVLPGGQPVLVLDAREIIELNVAAHRRENGGGASP